MKIVGLNHGEFNSSAALVVDGCVVAGAAEERFVRQKKTKIFPKNALNFCLSEQETQLANIDAFAQACASQCTQACYPDAYVKAYNVNLKKRKR